MVNKIFPRSPLTASDFILFNGLKNHLLLFYLIIMEVTLLIFGSGIFFLFSRDALEEVDQKLLILAQYAAPTLNQYYSQYRLKNRGLGEKKSVENVNPLQSVQFNSVNPLMGIEWFDGEKRELFRQGKVFPANPPLIGFFTWNDPNLFRIRSVTIQVSIERSQLNLPPLMGYVRVNQALTQFDEKQHRRLMVLVIAIAVTLGLVMLTGYWLTEKATKPVELSVVRLKQFTADASHELRGPLTAIRASLDVLRNHPERIHAKDISKIEVIANSTDRMTHLVKDLLFLARTDSNSLENSKEWVTISLNRLLSELMEWLDPVAKEKQVLLSYHDLSEVSIKGNQEQIMRLFSNLLENAINYTPKSGQVTVWVNRVKNLAQVKIEDTGVGIAPENLPYVFDRFWRADEARSRKGGGTGLGLSIAQAIAQVHQGKITVHSQPKVGSCFEVSLPLATK